VYSPKTKSDTTSDRPISRFSRASCPTERAAAASLSFVAVLCILLLAAAPAVQAQETLFYSFAPSPDGASPVAPLIVDSKGNLYGTTLDGGAAKYGTVFKITPGGVESVLHNFPATATDGALPEGGLVMDSAGNLYGTTSSGGTQGVGIVFELSPTGTETVLYNFAGGHDGGIPYGSLVLDSAGNLYGTTRSGGAYYGGTVFEVTPGGVETILHSFGHGTDGRYPYCGLVRDSSGNLYGTTLDGGTAGLGTVFELTAGGTESILHSFTGTGGNDGANPYSTLVRDSSGNLYGTTAGGNSGSPVVFEISPAGKETVIYVFPVGDDAYGGLVMDSHGNLFGTTRNGGTNKVGEIFEITNQGNPPTVYSFIKSQRDGYYPMAGPVIDSKGVLWGTTFRGGRHSNGAVYKFVP
jgi:uncharacterized repeat protein (TIGR03803 family)